MLSWGDRGALEDSAGWEVLQCSASSWRTGKEDMWCPCMLAQECGDVCKCREAVESVCGCVCMSTGRLVEEGAGSCMQVQGG